MGWTVLLWLWSIAPLPLRLLALDSPGSSNLLVLAGIGAEKAFHAAAGTGADFLQLQREVVPLISQKGQFLLLGGDVFQDGVQPFGVRVEVFQCDLLQFKVCIGSPDSQDGIGIGFDFIGVHVGGHRFPAVFSGTISVSGLEDSLRSGAWSLDIFRPCAVVADDVCDSHLPPGDEGSQ